MDSILKKYLRGDAVIWAVFIGLCFISAVEMFSASSTLAFKSINHTAPMLRHVLFLGMGALIAFVVHLIPAKYIRISAFILLAFSMVTLVLVLFRGKTENDATRWLQIGGFQFQPSELGKLSLIIIAADFIARIKNSAENEHKFFRILMVLSGIVCFLILLENFSTAVLLFGVIWIMMFVGKISIRKLFLIIAAIVGLGVFGFGAVKIFPQESMPKMFDRAYTWVNRIDRYLTEDKESEDKYVINDENLQVQHGRIAIARGGVFGVFPGNSVQRDFLPQAYSDFIYAIIVEEMGLVGGILVILLYMVLLFRAGRIATMSRTVFPAMLVIGLSLMIVLQAFVSMAVATSLGPVTGQPLPMISRGGTSILITSIYFGILLGITRQIKEEQGINNGTVTEEIIIEDDDEEEYDDVE
ncbi:MAG: FtsW/RodA/SpoVE family cell cycle protein [Paludibacter sp.]|nr:FtsW/RodA/SpoVE family cell cycle protein [Paludibacter sp.]MDD4428162.1 FtsW/RodA/SpoVE family cell cycle protein [Paludibacter sp.]